MRHQRTAVRRALSRPSSHRKLMLDNIATSVLDKERVVTTIAKAKEAQKVVERLITYGKRGGLHQVRIAARQIKNKDVLKKLFDDIAPGYAKREGGYTRIIKYDQRKGDNAQLVIFELVGRGTQDLVRKRRKKKGTVAPITSAPEAIAEKAAPATEQPVENSEVAKSPIPEKSKKTAE